MNPERLPRSWHPLRVQRCPHFFRQNVRILPEGIFLTMASIPILPCWFFLRLSFALTFTESITAFVPCVEHARVAVGIKSMPTSSTQHSYDTSRGDAGHHRRSSSSLIPKRTSKNSNLSHLPDKTMVLRVVVSRMA